MSGTESVIFLPSDAYGQFNVKEMSESDFALQSATPTAIKDQACHIILFYEPSSTDPVLIEMWAEIARNIGGPVIAAVNTSARREIMAAFFKVQGDFDDPFNAYTGFKYPSILAYRKRWPQAFYNGELSYDAIVGWIKTLACKPGYRELDAFDNANFLSAGSLSYPTGEKPEGEDGENPDGEDAENENPDEDAQPEEPEETPQEVERSRIAKLDSNFNKSDTKAKTKPSKIDPGFI